jgi:chromosome segregation ATPase
MATSEELENRVREMAGEINGEKAVTRHIFEQSRRNTTDLGAIRAEIGIMRTESGDRLDRLAGDMVLVNAALNSHGIRLDSLTRDVGLLRGDVTALRRGQEELHVRLDHVEGRLDRVESRLDRVESRLDHIESRLDHIESRLDTIERNIAAILAAVVPPRPAPGA